MRIIQSYWTCNHADLFNEKAGWLSPEYNLMGWALSCLQLNRFYSNIILYADSISAKILVDKLELPYPTVVCTLDKLNNYHPQLWALPKIYTYSQQDSAFLHVDGDVFIWSAFDKNLLSGGLIAQNMETNTGYYEHKFKRLESGLNYFPSEIQTERNNNTQIYAYNAGIFGGADIEFFKTYTQKAFEFVNKNIVNLTKINVVDFNIFFEQYLFYCLAKKENRKVSVLFTELLGDNQYTGFGDFTDVPHQRKYLHLLGLYKRNNAVCSQMAQKLRNDYPEYYYRIIALFRNAKAPMFKNYYHFTNCSSQYDLLERHNILKNGYRDNKLEKMIPIPCEGNAIPFDFLIPDIQGFSDQKDVADLRRFYETIHTVKKDKFSGLSKEYLYGRDLNASQYCEYLFSDTQTIYEKKVVADDIIEIVKSTFDWTRELNGKQDFIVKEAEELIVETHYTAIIPECDQNGFSADNVDELDVLILQTLRQPITILQLFNELKHSFNEDELEESKDEFEQLIFGRIKKGLVNKTIKCILPPNQN